MLLKAIKGHLPHVAQNMINLLIEWRGVGQALEAITKLIKKYGRKELSKKMQRTKKKSLKRKKMWLEDMESPKIWIRNNFHGREVA